jgi:hypothetical protein
VIIGVLTGVTMKITFYGSVLGCDAEKYNRCLPVFRVIVLHPFLVYKEQFVTLMIVP